MKTEILPKTKDIKLQKNEQTTRISELVSSEYSPENAKKITNLELKIKNIDEKRILKAEDEKINDTQREKILLHHERNLKKYNLALEETLKKSELEREQSAFNKAIDTRTLELVQQGYLEEKAREIAGIEELIRINTESKKQLEDNLEEEDREKKLISLEKNIDGNTKRKEELLGEPKTPPKTAVIANKKEINGSGTKVDTETSRTVEWTLNQEVPEGEKEMLPPEKIEDIEKVLAEKEKEFRNRLEIGSTSERIKGGVLKGIDKWNNFGKGEEGKKGFVKRFIKMGVNIALIGAISFVSVEKLAEAGVGTATALAGGSTSYLGNKLVISLGMGSAMELGGKKIPPKLQKLMPYLVGVGSITAATLMTGGWAGAAAGAGFIASKIVKEKFTNDKIEKREEKAKQKLLEKYKKDGETINPNNLEKIEKEYTKILKRYENQKIWGKLLGLGTGALVSSLVLEASGFAHDLKIEHQHQAETASTPHEKTDTEVKENEPLKWAGPSEPKSEEINISDKPSTHELVEIKHTPAEMQNILVHKGEGIEHSFIRQIESNHELAKELGYKGDLSDIKALHEFAGHEAHVLAIEEGYVDNVGHEIRVAEADKVGYEIKIENGHPIIHEETVEGKILETHHEGDKFEEHVDKGEYIKNPKVETSEHLTNIKEEPLGTHSQGETYIKEEPLGDNQIVSGISETKHVDIKEGELKDGVIGQKEASLVDPKNDSGLAEEKEGIQNEGQNVSLDPKVLEQINEVYEKNISHMFPDDKSMHAWEGIKDSHGDYSAEKLISRPIEDTNATFQPLVSQLQKIYEVTGLNPRGKTIFQPAESPNDFLIRGSIEAAKIEKLDDLSL